MSHLEETVNEDHRILLQHVERCDRRMRTATGILWAILVAVIAELISKLMVLHIIVQ